MTTRLAGPKDIVNRYHRPPKNLEELKKRARVDPPTGVWMVERATGQIYPGMHFQGARKTVIDGPRGLVTLSSDDEYHSDGRYDFVYVPRRIGVPVEADVDVEIRACLMEGVEPQYKAPDYVEEQRSHASV